MGIRQKKGGSPKEKDSMKEKHKPKQKSKIGVGKTENKRKCMYLKDAQQYTVARLREREEEAGREAGRQGVRYKHCVRLMRVRMTILRNKRAF